MATECLFQQPARRLHPARDTPVDPFRDFNRFERKSNERTKTSEFVNTENRRFRRSAVPQDILDFSKIEAEKMELERVGFSLRDQLEAATTVLAVRACRRNVEIIVDVRPDVPDNLMGDPGRLFQILVNLIGEAG